MKKVTENLKEFKKIYFPDFSWWELLEVLLTFLWIGFIGIFNGILTFDQDYPQYNLFQGRIRTGKIHLRSLHILRLIGIEELVVQLEITLSLIQRKLRVNFLTFHVSFCLPSSGVDYWKNEIPLFGDAKVGSKNKTNASTANYLSFLNDIFGYLLSLSYEINIKRATMEMNDELELVCANTKLTAHFLRQEYHAEVESLQISATSKMEKFPLLLIGNTSVQLAQGTTHFKLHLTSGKVEIQFQEIAILLILQYWLFWKQSYCYTVDCLRDYFDDRFDQLVTRLEFINKLRKRSGSRSRSESMLDYAEVQESYWLDDYDPDGVDFGHDFYFLPDEGTEDRPDYSIDLLVGIEELRCLVYASPAEDIKYEGLIGQGVFLKWQHHGVPPQSESPQSLDNLQFTVQKISSGTDRELNSIVPSNEQQVFCVYENQLIQNVEHRIFRGSTAPSRFRLSTRAINLLLWTSQEVSTIINMRFDLVERTPIEKQESIHDKHYYIWDQFEITFPMITLEIWQNETISTTNFYFNGAMAIQINLLEIITATPDKLKLSMNSVVIGPLIGTSEEINAHAGSIHPTVLLLSLEGYIPFPLMDSATTDIRTGKFKIVPCSSFSTFQEWDAYLLSCMENRQDLTIPEMKITIQACQIYATNRDLRILSIIATALQSHSTLTTVTVDKEFEILTATMLELIQFSLFIESMDVTLEHHEIQSDGTKESHKYQLLHHQTIEYQKVSTTHEYWSAAEFSISSPIQLYYSKDNYQNKNNPSEKPDRLLFSLVGGMRRQQEPVTPAMARELLREDSDEAKLREEREAEIVDDGNEDNADPSIRVHLKSGLSQSHWLVKRRLGFGARCYTVYTALRECSICMDVAEIIPLIRCINHYQGNVFRISYQRHLQQANNTDQHIHFTISDKIFHVVPTTVSHYSFQRFRCTLLHLMKPVLIVQTTTLQYSTVEFGPHLSQSSLEATSLQVGELSGDTVKHKLIVDNLSNANLNRLSYHITTRTGEYGLMEVNIDQVQVQYVHRAWMTLVTFIRDLFLCDLYSAFNSHPHPNPLPDYCHRRDPKGLYRVSAMIRRSECHLPISSFAPDALAIIFHHLNFYCTNDYLSKYHTYLSYSMGPYLAKRIWLSEMNNIRQYIVQLFPLQYENLDEVLDITDPELECRWKLAIQAFQEELICKLSSVEDRQWSQTAEWYMTIELFDATIASWCNRSAVCNGQDISCTIRNRPATPNSEDPLEVIDSEEYHTAAMEYRNTCIVDVLAEEIYWVLAQGQYWCIVNLIQQSFSEEYFHVQDPYIYPIWKTNFVNEQIYGRYGLNKDLPMISTVPVHILKGRIICIENDKDFFETFLLAIPEGEVLQIEDCHNFDRFISNSVPSYSNHIIHRDHCFIKWGSSSSGGGIGANIGGASAKKADKFPTRYETDREVQIDHDTDAPFCVLIEQLELDFYRMHFGGGSGIEVSATTFMVVAKEADVLPEDASSDSRQHGHTSTRRNAVDGDDILSQCSDSNYDDYDIKQIVVAPKDFASRRSSLLWSEKKAVNPNSSFQKSFSPIGSTKAINRSPYHQHLYGKSLQSNLRKKKQTPNKKKKLPSANQPERKPHIRYSQQSVNNLRRCEITVEDSVVVANFITAMAIVDFFHTPIRVNDQRNLRLVEELGKGRNDWLTHLDVEVHVKNSVLGLPNIPATIDQMKQRPVLTVENSPGGPMALASSSCLCFELNLDYLQGWRGFVESGPGSMTFTLLTTIYATFIAPINELPSKRSCRMFAPVKIQFLNELKVLPQKEHFERNWGLIRPWIHFGDWIHGVNRFPRASGARQMRFTIDLVDEEEEVELLREEQRRKSFHAVKEEDSSDSNSSSDDSDADEREKGGDVNLRKRRNNTPSTPGKSREEVVEKALKEEVVRDNGDNEGRSRTDTQASYEMNESSKTGASSTKAPKKLTHGELSLKDIEFIISAINCFQGNMHRRVRRVPKTDPYEEISFNLSDISFMPDLTYYLVNIELPNGYKVDVKEFFTEFCDFEFLVRNNTYNLKLAKLHLSGIDAHYFRHPQNFHIASMVKASAWTFNDTIDEWEPLIEPIYMQAVAATDSSRGNVVSSLTSANKILVKVETESLEVNASSVAIDNLLRKIRLNDVVTTSSKKLPPYKIMNELGVDVFFRIGYSGAIVVAKEIKPGDTFPIEISQLIEKLQEYKGRSAYSSERFDASLITAFMDTKEYLLWVSFPNFRDQYSSRVPLSIDRVGTTPFEMTLMPSETDSVGRKRQGSLSAAFSSVATTTEPGNHSEMTSLPSFLTQTGVGGPSVSGGSGIGSGAIKFLKEVPLALLEMKIKEDGVRELRLKSILSFRNLTHRLAYLSLRLFGSSFEVAVPPGKDYSIPVRFANPKTAFFIRFDSKTPWLEAASHLANFINGGLWGDPLKLKADILTCPTENNDMNETWTILLRPEVRSVKSTTGALVRTPAIPIKYPTRDTQRQKHHHAGPNTGIAASNEYSTEALEEMSLATMASSTNSSLHASAAAIHANTLRTKTSGIIRPLCIHLQPPLQLLNLLPQALLYRLADGNGVFNAHGLILPGQLIDIHNLPQLFQAKLFISVRMINYSWSKWTMLFSRTNPFLLYEKATDISLQSLHFLADEKSFHLPSLELCMINKEYLVRFTCQCVLSNSTAQPLRFADPSNYELSLPIDSHSSIHKYLEGTHHLHHQHHHVAGVGGGKGIDPSQRLRNERSRVSLTLDDLDDDDDDDTGSSLYDESLSQTASSNDPFFVSEPSVDGSSLDPRDAITAKGPIQKAGAEPIISITVYLPTDHCRRANVIAAGSWTLAEVFNHIKHHFTALPIHAQFKDYAFFPYQVDMMQGMSSKAEVQELNKLAEDDALTSPEGGGPLPSGNNSNNGGNHEELSSGKDNVKGKDKEKSVEVTDHEEVPNLMRFDMGFDFHIDSLSPNLPIAAAPEVLILCHTMEYQIYQQAATIRTTKIEQEGRFFKSIFGKAKYHHHATFYPIKGDFPFRPKKLLGFNPLISLCIPGQTDWSTGIDFTKADTIEMGELIVRLPSTATNSTHPVANSNASMTGKDVATTAERRKSTNRLMNEDPALAALLMSPSIFEFGAFIEKGRGLFHNTTVVTIVPKHLFYSRLPFDIEIRLVEEDRITTSLTLAANAATSFHFPKHTYGELEMKTFQLRQIEWSVQKTLIPCSDWIGEFDISVLGTLYAKLVTPTMTMILKIETELVGASLVTTFREQNIQWPPYRIDNMTDYRFRFRQSMIINGLNSGNNSSSTAFGLNNLSSSGHDRGLERRPSYDPTSPTAMEERGMIGLKVVKDTKWDEAPPGGCSSYCWEYPLTGDKLLQIEIIEGMQSTKGLVSLDDDSKIEVLPFVKTVPNIGNPLAADELLMLKDSNDSSILTAAAASVTSSNWLETYCIVRPDVVYVYKKTRESLVKVVNLSIPNGYTKTTTPDEEDQVNSIANTLPKFAIVTKYVGDKGWDIMSTVTSTVGFLGSMMGSGATTTSKGVGPTATANSTGVTTSTVGGVSFDINSIRRLILLLADEMKLFATCSPETFNISKPRSTSVDEDSLSQKPPDEAMIRMQSRRRSIMQRSLKSLHPQEPEVIRVHTLQSLLQAKISVDQLLDEVCNYPIRMSDFLAAVQALRIVDNEDKAVELFLEMYSVGYISTIEGGQAIMGGSSSTMFANSDSNKGSPENSRQISREGSNNNLEEAERLNDSPTGEILKSAGSWRPISNSTAGPVEKSMGRDSISSSPGLLGNIIADENYFTEDRTVSLAGGVAEETNYNLKASRERGDMPRSLTMTDATNSITPPPPAGSKKPPLSRVLGFGGPSTGSGGIAAAIGAATTGHASLKKKMLPTIIESFGTVDLFFNAPSIVAEFIENMNQAAFLENEAMMQSSEGVGNNNMGPNNASGSGSEGYGVSIYLSPTQKYHFKCSTYLAFCGWIQACRNAIEQSFVDYVVNRTNPIKRKEKLISLEDYQVNIVMKVRPDGSTKVLEILEGEIEPAKVKSSFASSLSSLITGKKSPMAGTNVISTRKKKAMARAALLMPFVSGSQPLMIKYRATSSRLPAATSTSSQPEGEDPSGNATAASGSTAVVDDSDQELINVSFHVNSVSLSLIDATPYEILYLRLHNIHMKVLRYVDSVKFTVAVEQIDISNQLLSPSFPVALFARKKTKDQQATSGNPQRKFPLPGYDEMSFVMKNTNEYPALYLHMHQRYYKDTSAYASTNRASIEGEDKQPLEEKKHHEIPPSNQKKKHKHNNDRQLEDQNQIKLWYFDIFTLWLTPLQLALEEEFVVRFFRYIQSLRNSLQPSTDSKRSRKLKEDQEYYVHATQSGGSGAGGGGLGSSHASTASLGSVSSAGGGSIGPGGTGVGGGSINAYHHSSKMVELDPFTVYDIYNYFMDSGRRPYSTFRNTVKSSLHMYFNLLQLHPLDISFYFRPSPGIQITNAELALLSVISQLDSSRLCLNALFAQHAYGSSNLITEILVKHYRTSFWRQFHRLISGVDPIDNTVGLVATVGGGVFDISYESMESVMESLGAGGGGSVTITTTSGKGGVSSLASKALVGASAITSKMTGGLGKGVSLLTLDTEFQRTRGYRRYVKASTVSEGIIVGTQELGKNIVEGVTGVVVAPMKGWETGGSVGFGVGVAKGVLGFALKPAVGVFDLASRATEGLRNTASTLVDEGIVTQLQTIHRTRLPRAFSNSGLLVVYDAHAAGAQYLTDSLTGFKYETRLTVIEHLFLRRKRPRSRPGGAKGAGSSSVFIQARPYSLGFLPSIKNAIVANDLSSIPSEFWGLRLDTFYLTIVCPDRVALIQLSPMKSASSSKSQKQRSASITGNTESTGVKFSQGHNKGDGPNRLARKWIWSCPSHCIDQLCSDSRGDLIVVTSQPIVFPASASQQLASQQNNQLPVVLDLDLQNYFLFQSLLEQSIGISLARQHPLTPKHQGYLEGNIKKRYVSGIRSYILAPTSHVYRIFGNVLYEYTKKVSTSNKSKKVAEEEDDEAKRLEEVASTRLFFNPEESNSEDYAEYLLYQLFPIDDRFRDSDTEEEEEVGRKGAESPPLDTNQDLKSTSISGKDLSPSKESFNSFDNTGVEGNQNVSTTKEQHSLSESKISLVEPEVPTTISEQQLNEDKVPADKTNDITEAVKENVTEKELQLPSSDHSSISPSSNQYSSTDTSGRNETVGESKSTPTTPVVKTKSTRAPVLSLPFSSSNKLRSAVNTLLEDNTPITEESLEKDYFLSFVYPLVDLSITGPNSEDNQRIFSITLSSKLSPAKMRVIRRDEESEQFVEYHKNGLSLLFTNYEQALQWRHRIEQRLLFVNSTPAITSAAIANQLPPSSATSIENDLVPVGPLKSEDRSNYYSKLNLSRTGTGDQSISTNTGGVNISAVGGGSGSYNSGMNSSVVAGEGSILSLLILPTAAVKPEDTERLKIEIAKVKRV